VLYKRLAHCVFIYIPVIFRLLNVFCMVTFEKLVVDATRVSLLNERSSDERPLYTTNLSLNAAPSTPTIQCYTRYRY